MGKTLGTTCTSVVLSREWGVLVYPERVAAIEACAVELLSAVGDPIPAISALALADAFGLEVKRGFGDLPAAVADALQGRLLPARGLIEVAATLDGRAFHEAVARELGYWALREGGLPVSRGAAETMAAALMMPLAGASLDYGAPLELWLWRNAHCTLRIIEIRLEALAGLLPAPSSSGAS